ncbi:MAG: hypothetical protein D6730_07290 [Bacteroidetes bacterium]|nr:MAG: hypothetical protein D6730_07290 [Bacteroidota bacterium]
MFAKLIKESFPQDEKAGLYRTPNLPAVKLGKILRKEKRIASPSDVLAMHLYSGMFSSGAIIFTADRCFYEDGAFDLEEVKDCQVKDDHCIVLVNQKGQLVPHKLSVKNEQVAKTLKKVFDAIAYYDPKSEALMQQAAKKYEEAGFKDGELNWLLLRDEVMRTIDMLYERYNDGKLSILEYEDKKAELLSRL